MNPSVFGSLCVIWCVAASDLGAQAPRPTCERPEYRQFDFWVGDWVVTSGGQPAGTNRVTLEERGCLIHEHWSGTDGGSGQSFNFYDRSDGRWHQVWVNASGNVLMLSGEYRDGRLTLNGERPAAGSGSVLHRLTFSRNDDGAVRQLWESSTDDGRTWTTVFDGLYTKTG